MLGERLAEIALRYGANDLDGTVMEEKITHAAGAKTPQHLPAAKLIEIAKAAGKRIALRDAFCNVIKWYT